MSSHQLLRTENRSGHVTIQAPVYIGNHMFKVNNQYEFSKVEIYLVGCGCNGTKKEEKKYYLLTVGSNKYSVEERYVVETDVPIPESAQNFDEARRDQHRNPGTDFSDIVAHPDPNQIWQQANEQARDGYIHNDRM